MSELESSLSSSIKNDNLLLKSNTNVDIENMSDITTPMDEVNFWMRVKEDRRSPHKNFARLEDQALSVISTSGFQDLDILDISDMPDLINRGLGYGHFSDGRYQDRSPSGTSLS